MTHEIEETWLHHLSRNVPVDKLREYILLDLNDAFRWVKYEKLPSEENERARMKAALNLVKANIATLEAYLWAAGPDFLKSVRWQRVRMDALEKSNGCCDCCGHRASADAPLNVDHVVPRVFAPWRALDLTNLQVLCAACNSGKGNRYTTNWSIECDPWDS